jgi:hypothetical protein
MPEATSRTPTFIALGLVALALVVAAASGFSSGSLPGAALALTAVVPAAYGMWRGMQEPTQAGLGLAVLGFLLALAAAGLLVVLKLIDWIR